jgi:hypothetical protein
MSVLKRVGVPALAAVSLVGATLAFSGSADARYYHRGWRSGGLVGAAIVGGVAIGTTVPAPRPYYYRYGFGYGYPNYAPAGPFVDYPYPNCASGVCWY